MQAPLPDAIKTESELFERMMRDMPLLERMDLFAAMQAWMTVQLHTLFFSQEERGE